LAGDGGVGGGGGSGGSAHPACGGGGIPPQEGLPGGVRPSATYARCLFENKLIHQIKFLSKKWYFT